MTRLIKMIQHKTSQNARMNYILYFVSNNNAIPNPRPHDNAITKMKLICHLKDKTDHRDTAKTKYAVTKTELIVVTKIELIVNTQLKLNIPSQRGNSITITKTGAKISMSHRL